MRRADSPWFTAGYTAEWWERLTQTQRIAFMDALTDLELDSFFRDWRVWARDNQLAPEGKWTTWLALAGRGWGKALALDTPIATASGWTTMGEITAGTIVFDEKGNPTRVTKAHDILLDRDCYRVRFSDGSSIVADGDHLWLTETKASRKADGRAKGTGDPRRPQCQRVAKPKVRTTAEIRRTLWAGKAERNHSIPVTKPLLMPHALLPIEPYLLGCWLGDGTSAAGEITTADEEIVQAFIDAGESVAKARAAGGRSSTYPITAGYVGPSGRAATFAGRLRRLGVLRNKHVPASYLRAAPMQRLELLQGLMDTDGYAEASKAEFCTTSRALADGVLELIHSLGMVARMAESRAMLNGRDCGPRWRIQFRPQMPVFRIKRKAAACKPLGKQASRTGRRFIVAVEPVESVPVRCITVASESHLYLAGTAMIPTHNTRTMVELINDEIKLGRLEHIAIVGQGEGDIRKVMIEGNSGFLATASAGWRPVFQPSLGQLVWPNGTIGAMYSAADPEALRGPEFDFGWFDEPMAVPAEARQKTVSNLKFGLRRGNRPRLVYSTTPKPHRWLTDELQKAAKYAHLPLAERKYITSRGSTLENRRNLPESFFDAIMEDYDRTTLGRQEIYAEIIGTEEGALWTAELLDQQRLLCPETLDDRDMPGEWPTQLLQAFANTCDKVVVAVDPNLTADSKIAHAAGIMVLGKRDDKIYVIADRTTKGGPHTWSRAAVRAAIEFGADEIVAEVNQGGDMVRIVLQAAMAEFSEPVNAKVHMVRASKGKQRRAEPVATAYERKQVFHLGPVGTTNRPGPMFLLENQMCSLHDAYDPTGEDFDRCDAMVWGATRLGVRNRARFSTSHGLGGFLTFQDFGNGSTHH